MILALPIALMLIFYNLKIYDVILSPYSNPIRIFSNPFFLEALIGNLLSPSRGLFIFTPIFLFSVYGAIRINNLYSEKISFYLVTIILLHWIVISTFPHWWGGHSFGPRFFSDMIPYFVFFIILFLKEFNLYPRNKKILVAIFLVLLVGMSFFIHYQGAYRWAVYDWNMTPNNVDLHPNRLWDWHDIQFLRGISKGLLNNN